MKPSEIASILGIGGPACIGSWGKGTVRWRRESNAQQSAGLWLIRRAAVDGGQPGRKPTVRSKAFYGLRGSRIVNSLYSPTSLSTVIVPPCCFVTMS